MGQLADALRAKLRAVAESDARALREIDQELKAASAWTSSSTAPAIPGPVDVKSLLDKGNFRQQTVAVLRRLCKENGIKGFSKMKKPELCRALEAKGVQPPAPPLESFSKKELVAMLKGLLG